MCPATGVTLISLSQNELRPTQPGFVLAVGSRLTPLVPALDSPKLSTPTVLVSAGSVIQPRAGLIAMGSSSPQPSMSVCIYLHCRHLGRFHLSSRWSSQKSRTRLVSPVAYTSTSSCSVSTGVGRGAEGWCSFACSNSPSPTRPCVTSTSSPSGDRARSRQGRRGRADTRQVWSARQRIARGEPLRRIIPVKWIPQNLG